MFDSIKEKSENKIKGHPSGLRSSDEQIVSTDHDPCPLMQTQKIVGAMHVSNFILVKIGGAVADGIKLINRGRPGQSSF